MTCRHLDDEGAGAGGAVIGQYAGSAIVSSGSAVSSELAYDWRRIEFTVEIGRMAQTPSLETEPAGTADGPDPAARRSSAMTSILLEWLHPANAGGIAEREERAMTPVVVPVCAPHSPSGAARS
jgi:hypothetical protein